jgi:putative RecB family exonuclease
MTCPLLYRYRSIDRLPERPSTAAVRGTLVHSVLERLFDAPRQERSPEGAVLLLKPAWDTMTKDDPSLRALLFGPEENWQRHLADQTLSASDPDAEAKFMGEAQKLIEGYFNLEDPKVLEPDQREAAVSYELESGLTLRGIVDRIDKAPGGQIRIVDYKTGRSPGQGWEDKALFQMRFYGLVIWRLTGQIPTRLQLMYLGNQEILSIDPTESQLTSTQAKLEALWQAIETAQADKNWQPRTSKLCDWCSFQQYCPEWGGTPPPLPAD